ncbi:MAG: hypothetical protein HC806_07145 [Anaerolineae bacterium]|nr:hypothetical protein [Anaerolineae bacterium]
MISTERLRMYPFFGFLDPKELEAIAMIAEETAYPKQALIFHIDQPAQALYLLEKGVSNYITNPLTLSSNQNYAANFSWAKSILERSSESQP